jgi:hypothetical protein
VARAKVLGTIAKGGGKAAKVVLKEINPLDVLRVYLDYRKTAEIQVTERERIWAERDKALAAIEAERDLLLVYFKQRFEERKGALEQFFGLLKEGSIAKDADKIDVALEGILGVVKDSPLKDFESFRRTRREGRIIDI